MSSYDAMWFEEAIGWQGLRAMREAMDNLPAGIPATDDVHVSVQVRVRSTSWPGTTDSGRSKPTLIGSADCVYRGKREGGKA